MTAAELYCGNPEVAAALNRAARRFGVSLGDAYAHFAAHYPRKYRESCDLGDWTLRVAENGIRNDYRQHRHHTGERLDYDPEVRYFDLTVFLADLSNDAKDVVFLALENLNDGPKRGPKSSKRNTLIRLLRRLGWGLSRITASFNEIREALNSTKERA